MPAVLGVDSSGIPAGSVTRGRKQHEERARMIAVGIAENNRTMTLTAWSVQATPELGSKANQQRVRGHGGASSSLKTSNRMSYCSTPREIGQEIRPLTMT